MISKYYALNANLYCSRDISGEFEENKIRVTSKWEVVVQKSRDYRTGTWEGEGKVDDLN
jgi:hypothetical protein